MDFTLPTIIDNEASWGPPMGTMDISDIDFGPLGINFNLAYEHLDKYGAQQDRNFKIGKCCDFTLTALRYQEQRAAKGKSKGKGRNPAAPDKDEDGFALVDNKPPPGKSFGKGRAFGRSKGKGRGLEKNSTMYQEGLLGQKQKQQTSNAKAKGKGRNNYTQRRTAPSNREWSVQTQPDWALKFEIELKNLCNIQIDARAVEAEDILWCGELRQYNKDFDKIEPKTERNIRRYEDMDFFDPTTFSDPKLTELIESDQEITVIATAQVLACLVAAARSQYSWDLVLQTFTDENGRKVLIIDKRESSPINLLTVNETATNAPQNEESEKKEFNSMSKLCQEATCINQNFSQFVLTGEAETMEEPNPFCDDAGQVASGAIRYRKIRIPGNAKESSEAKQKEIVLAVRTEVNCKMPGARGEEKYASVKALNEYDPKPAYSWRKLLQGQHGSLMAQELKNNSFKVGRWTAEAILAECDVMKIGYATRKDPNDPWTHSVLHVQTLRTNDFASQIGMHRNNMYGIIRNIVDIVMEWDDGKYLILKDPMKHILRIYEVDPSFGDEDEEDDAEVDEDDDPEVDEEGNIAPMQAVGPNL